MEKIHFIGRSSMTEKAYKEFVSLSKEKQVQHLLKTMSPKNEEYARELLKNVPNGDNISKRTEATSGSNNASTDKGGSAATGAKGSKADSGQGK